MTGSIGKPPSPNNMRAPKTLQVRLRAQQVDFFNLIKETEKWQLQIERSSALINLVGHMKTSEFKRFLASKGAKFVEGAKHTKIYVNGKQTTLPRHAKELGDGLRKAILRQLEIKD